LRLLFKNLYNNNNNNTFFDHFLLLDHSKENVFKINFKLFKQTKINIDDENILIADDETTITSKKSKSKSICIPTFSSVQVMFEKIFFLIEQKKID
jgi:hypothetical protein